MNSTLLNSFYSIESTSGSDQTYVTKIRLNKDHEIFNGHFPDRPVTPGVILMQLFKEEIQRIINKKVTLKTASNIKFMSVVNPFEDDIFIMNSTININGDQIELKGIGGKENGICIKINTVYTIN